MNKSLKLIVLTLLVATSAFADQRLRNETIEGRIRDIDRNRNQLVIRLDRVGYVLLASPRQASRLDRGDFIRATGEISRGRMLVDRITLLRDDDRDRRSVTGIVESVEPSRRLVWLRDDRTGRTIAVDLRNAERNDRRWDNERSDRWNDISQIRRGDRLRARGSWRGDVFEANRYDLGEDGRW